MSRPSLVPVLLAAVTWLAAAPVAAAVPSPATSTVDPCLRVCPAGDMTFHVLVRDVASNPVPSSTVVIDLCPATTVVLCPPGANDGYTIVGGCQVVKVTNAAGVASFQIRAGGTWSGGAVTVRADGVQLSSIPAVASPDQDGSLMVNAADQAILAAKMSGPYDRTGDFNCSDALDPGDPNILAEHLDHSCAAVVPVRPGTWGLLKTLYR